MRTKQALTMRFMACLLGLLLVAGLASASVATAMPATDSTAPSIGSDKADYAPGELVTLTGTGWQPAESVHIRVNDDAGSSWSRDVDVTAGADGAIADSFNLPDWFVAEYSVVATGSSGSEARASFTDGNVKVAVTGGTAGITETLYSSSTNCSGAVNSGYPKTPTIPPTDTVGVGSSQSVRLDAPATASGGQAFLGWSKPANGNLVFTTIAGTSGRSVCVVGFQSGSEDIIAGYASNSAPTMTGGNATVTVDEGATAGNTGSYSDANGDTVTFSASRGAVTKTGASSGTWTWSFATTDGPDQTGPVTITASDGKTGGTATTTFTLNVANVAPTVTPAAGNALSVDEGSTHTYNYSIVDPGADAVSSVQTSCGANGVKVAGSDANTSSGGSFKCTFADGPASSIVSASATDSDGATGNLATQTVTIANVAPAVTLTGPATADEGQTKTYSFTVSDPGQDTFSVDAVFPDCDAGATNNGTFVAGSLAVTAAGGSFQCFFADGPASADVKIQVRDSDGASEAASQSVQVVAVANVAPSVTTPAGQAGEEGASKSFDLGSFADPGADSPWAVEVAWGDGSAHTTFDTSLTGTLGAEDHAYADSGTYTVSVKVTDKNGASDTKTFEVDVANVAPTVTLAADNDLSVDEGSTHTYNYSIIDPGADTVSSVQTSCGANGVKSAATNANTSGSFKCRFPDGTASSAVSVSATDSDGDEGAADSQTVAVANVAPTVGLTGADKADEGQTKTYSFTVSDPGQDTFVKADGFPDCDADITDNGTLVAGSYAATASGGSFECFFADGPATANVKMKVTDSDGASDTDSESVQIVAVANVAPSATAPADQAADEGAAQSVQLGSFTDPGPDAPWAITVSWGDGSDSTFDTAGTGSLGSRSHTYADSGSYTVSVKVTDKNGAADTKSFEVDVANVAPTVTLAADNALSVDEGSTHTYNYSIFDPGADSVSSVQTSCGASGVKVAGSDTNTDTSGSFECTFPDGPANSTVSVTATDSDGATGAADTQPVAVANVVPSVSLTGADTAKEGETNAYSFTVSDPGQDTFSVDAGFPDCDAAAGGSFVAESLSMNATGGSFRCFFADGPATADVKIKVRDSDGASDTDSESVTVVAVANVAPSVTAPADQSGDEGASVSVDLGSFSDPGPDAPWAVEVAWGDGSAHTTFDMSMTGTLGAEDHTFADSGSYTVSVKVTDKNGASDTKTFTVTVANVAPTVTLSAGNDLAVGEGSTHTYGYSISDPGADTVDSVATSCGANGVKSDATNTDSGGSFKCMFADGPASSTVSVSATDSDGDEGAADRQTVAVANVAPTVHMTGADTADEGETKTYSFTVSDPGDDTFDASAGFPDCDAGTTDNATLVAGSYAATASGGSFECSFPDGPATANVKMKVADSDGASGTDSESVQIVAVANVAPTVTAPADQAADEGAAKSLDLGSFTDPGPDAPWAVDVDWGDSSVHTTFDATDTGSLGNRSHTYADGPATRTVTVKVIDKNGASDSKTFNVAVANVAPTADLGNDGPKPEGSSVTVSFTNAADASSGDVTAGLRYGFACTASAALPATYAAAGAGASKSCTFPDNGTYPVKGRIFDRDNGYRTYDTTVTVTNAAPTITSFTGTDSLAGPLAFAPGTFKTDFTDPGSVDTHRADFTWSSGSPLTQTVSPFVTGQSVTHTLAAGCNRTATAKITDKDGDSDTKTTSVNVGTGAWLPPLADQPVSDKLKNGQVLPVKVKIADCNGIPVTGLAPVIQLLKGDQTAVTDDTAQVITISSVSAADSGTTMRSADGFYVYNLKVSVASSELGKDYTIIVHPYGTGSPQTLRHVIVPIK